MTIEEEHLRFIIYAENKKRIAEHNKMAFQGKHSYFLEMNSFGDMLSNDFKIQMNGYILDVKEVLIIFKGLRHN